MRQMRENPSNTAKKARRFTTRPTAASKVINAGLTLPTTSFMNGLTMLDLISILLLIVAYVALIVSVAR